MNQIKEKINEIYYTLLEIYSPQDWWPVSNYEKADTKNKKYFSQSSNEDKKRFEIIMGAILTQNTSWASVEKSLDNLARFSDFSADAILDFIDDDLDIFKQQIKPSGYFNQKAIYLRNISEFILNIGSRIPTRKELLSVKGVGNETADSILLYAYSQKEFVVDAYTKRIFTYLGFFDEKATYLYIKNLFESNFDGDVDDYKYYHGLIVNHAKIYYRNKPYGVGDEILSKFKVSGD